MADWDRFAERYDGVFTRSRLYEDTLDLIAGMARDSGGRRFLDIGCGTGGVSARLLGAVREATVLGVDPSAGMRETCSRRFEGTGRFRVAEGGALSIPAPADSFDGAFTNLALHHVPPHRRGECAFELARVLEPGGLLVYADLFSDVGEAGEEVAWRRDMIDKHVAMSLYCLEHGAGEMAILLMDTLPRTIRREGEYLTTDETWVRALREAGFGDLSVIPVEPERCGTRIIRGVLNPGTR